MKKWTVLFALLVGNVGAGPFDSLLTWEDREMEREDFLDGPSLTSMSDHQVHWESFNQWQCFSKEQLYFECVNYDENTLVPSIRVETDVESLFFDLHVEDNFACEETLAIWDDLFQGGAEFCVYAAHMKSFDLDKDEESQKVQTLWYIEKLKGHSGYWDIYKP
jgi:hypothetical protein